MTDSDDPVTGTLIGLTAVSTGLGIYGAIGQGRTQADTAITNSRLRARELIGQAQMAENDVLLAERDAQESIYAAASEREATAFDVARQREQAEALQAQQRVDIAGSGLEASGSPLLVMAETAKQLELDRLATTHAGEVRARAHEDEARMSRYGGQLSAYQAEQLRKGIPLTLDIGRYQARASRQAGTLGAIASGLSGATRLASIYGSRGS